MNREQHRLELQARLDSQKTQLERNRLGQFATPTALADEILHYAKTLLPRGDVRFLDPAVGTGAFYSALLRTFSAARIASADGFEIDDHYGAPAVELWRGEDLKLHCSDFTRAKATPSVNLLICNPPYVRHHHITVDEKTRLSELARTTAGVEISGLAGLYSYFMALSHAWLAPGAISGWLIPSEFMDVNYGRALKRYLLENVTLLRIHRFDPNDIQFADALVSSAVVWFKNEVPTKGHEVLFTFGGNHAEPQVTRAVSAVALARESKWTRFPKGEVREQSGLPTIADFFSIKRGLATGDNSYFILSEVDIVTLGLPRECFTPILPSPRHVAQDEIFSDSDGVPLIEKRQFLLNTRLSEAEIGRRYPSLAAYLEKGRIDGLPSRYLCSHRSPWYSQEDRPAPPIVCTYMVRGESARPFRFIRNESRATVANVYLAMYPKPPLSDAIAADRSLLKKVWAALNELAPDRLLGESRVYGGGLYKLEPKELANVQVPEIAAMLPKQLLQTELFSTVA